MVHKKVWKVYYGGRLMDFVLLKDAKTKEEAIKKVKEREQFFDAEVGEPKDE